MARRSLAALVMRIAAGVSRRHALALLSAGAALQLEPAAARPIVPVVTLLDAPLVLAGAWGGSAPGDVAAVIGCMRAACLGGAVLLSDRQPQKLRIEDHSGGAPSIWLHAGEPTTGWIIVIVKVRDWCNLAYQFGHELGHVLANSWAPDATPRPPCQWIEEALVEAFSLRGLGRLADAWSLAPPFPGDGAYAGSIRGYRDNIIGDYREVARTQQTNAGFGAWYARNRSVVEGEGGLASARGAVSTIFDLLEADETTVEDIGALNRWPGRSSVELRDYLDLWKRSCAELGATGRLPMRLRKLLLES